MLKFNEKIVIYCKLLKYSVLYSVMEFFFPFLPPGQNQQDTTNLFG